MIVEQSISLKGSPAVNEDLIGYSKNYYWLMDGVTDLFNFPFFNVQSDAHHLVHRIHDILPSKLDEQKSLVRIMTETMKELTPYLGQYPDIPTYKFPTFTIVFVRYNENGVLEYLILGDSSLIIEGEKILTDVRLEEYNRKNNPVQKDKETRLEKRSRLEKTRKLLNTEEGYWIGSMDAKGFEHAITGTLELKDNQRIILCSDGFSNYFENQESLLQFSFTSENIVHVLQEIMKKSEQESSAQLKKRDDLSLLVLRKE